MTGKKVVLIVEDEPLLLLDAEMFFEDAGFEVETAPNADKAIEILLARSDIGIVFTDIEMPGSMDGMKLAAMIRDRWPPIQLIVASGKVNVRDGDLPSGGLFFRKPYDLNTVLGAIAA